MPESQTALADLLGKIESAEGPDREIDALVHEALCGRITRMPLSGPVLDDGSDCPRYTADIAAAINLVERKLPGVQIGLLIPDRTFDKQPEWGGEATVGKPRKNQGWTRAKTPALALLAALLRALSPPGHEEQSER